MSTLQDILRSRQKDVFIGRVDQINLFANNLELLLEDTRKKFIFNAFGQGGIGKTSLLRQFRQISESKGYSVAWSDEAEDDTPAAMASIAKHLAISSNDHFKHFNTRYRTYLQHRQELEADPEAPQGIASFLGRTIAKTGIKLARRIPIAGVALDFVEDEALAEQMSDLGTYIARKLTNKDDIRLMQSPLAELTPLLLEGLTALTKHQPVALFFDTYEKSSQHLDSWLREVLDGRYGNVSANIAIIIAGREELNSNLWSSYDGLIARLPLQPFDDDDLRHYLSQKEITNPKIIESISRLSGRIPLLVATLAWENPKNPDEVDDPSETAVERFLKWISEIPRRQLALNAAIPRRLNHDIISTISTTTEASDESFRWLKNMPFVEERLDSWTYHEVVRTQLLRYKRRESPQEWDDLHERLAGHYAQRKEKLALSLDEGWNSSTWQSYSNEELYHRLCQPSFKLLPSVVNEYLEAYKRDTILAQRWAETISQAGADSDNDSFIYWGRQLYSATRDDTNRENIETFSNILKMGGIEPRLRVVALFQRAKLRFWSNQVEEALADLDEAIAAQPNLPLLLVMRGMISSFAGDTQAGEDDIMKGLEIDPELPAAELALGLLNTFRGNREEAIRRLNRAAAMDQRLSIFPQLESILYDSLTRSQGIDMSDFLQKLQHLASTLDPQDKFESVLTEMTENLGEQYELLNALRDNSIDQKPIPVGLQKMVELVRAGEAPINAVFKDIPRAVVANLPTLLSAIVPQILAPAELPEEIGDSYREVFTSFIGSISERSSEQTQREQAESLASFSAIYRRLGQLNYALDICNEALLKDPGNSYALAARSSIYIDLGLYNEALADLEGGGAQHSHGNLDGSLNEHGLLLTYLGRYEEAAKIFQECLQEDPISPTCLYNLAIATTKLKGPEASHMERENARNALISLVEENQATGLYGLGGLHAVVGEVTLALNDLASAVLLDAHVVKWARQDVAWSDLSRDDRFVRIISHNESEM